MSQGLTPGEKVLKWMQQCILTSISRFMLILVINTDFWSHWWRASHRVSSRWQKCCCKCKILCSWIQSFVSKWWAFDFFLQCQCIAKHTGSGFMGCFPDGIINQLELVDMYTCYRWKAHEMKRTGPRFSLMGRINATFTLIIWNTLHVFFNQQLSSAISCKKILSTDKNKYMKFSLCMILQTKYTKLEFLTDQNGVTYLFNWMKEK